MQKHWLQVHLSTVSAPRYQRLSQLITIRGGGPPDRLPEAPGRYGIQSWRFDLSGTQTSAALPKQEMLDFAASTAYRSKSSQKVSLQAGCSKSDVSTASVSM